jgi:hypothetical protein
MNEEEIRKVILLVHKQRSSAITKCTSMQGRLFNLSQKNFDCPLQVAEDSSIFWIKPFAT